MTKNKIEIKVATKVNWERIIEIYNQAILEGGKTADIKSVSIDGRKEWLTLHLNKKYPIIIAELNSQIVGWCSLSPYRPGRKALEKTAEISYYVDINFRKRGIASLLIKNAIKTAKQSGIKNLIAILLDINKNSILILEKFGFEKWGHLPNIAELKGKVCGQFIYGNKITKLN